MEREMKGWGEVGEEKEKGADIHEQEKNGRIDEREAGFTQEERRSRGWGTAAPQITAQLVIGVSR